MEAYFWFIASGLLLVIEIATLGLTTIWFAVGALVTGFCAMAGANVLVQLLVFVAVAIVLLILTRPLAVKYLNNRTEKTNADSLIGELCIVTEPINNLKAEGQASVRGQEWTARSADDILIAAGTKVRIISISGVKLMVRPEGENEEERAW